jgi:hypothetical protein
MLVHTHNLSMVPVAVVVLLHYFQFPVKGRSNPSPALGSLLVTLQNETEPKLQ